VSHVKLQTLSAFAAQSEDMSVPTSQPSDIVSSVVTADPSPTDSLSAGVIGGVVVLDQERKIRREIANSNERRRMQSINAGFQSLRTLLPQHEGEKLSKAAILQQTAEYIYSLEQEKTRLLAQNCQLKRLLSLSQSHLEDGAASTTASAVAPHVGNNGQTLSATTATVPTVATSSGTKRRRSKHDQGVMAVAESSKKTTPATGITGNIQTTAKKFTVQNEEVALRLIPAAAPAEVKRSSGSESASDIGTCRIIVAPNSEAVLKENLFIDSGGSGNCSTIIETSNAAKRSSTTSMSKLETIPSILSPGSAMDKGSSSTARSYIVTTSSSKQNLDSIVEAIRHLEGDHLFTTPESATVTVSSSGEVAGPQQVAGEEVVEYSADDKSSSPAMEEESTSVIILNNCS